MSVRRTQALAIAVALAAGLTSCSRSTGAGITTVHGLFAEGDVVLPVTCVPQDRIAWIWSTSTAIVLDLYLGPLAPEVCEIQSNFAHFDCCERNGEGSGTAGAEVDDLIRARSVQRFREKRCHGLSLFGEFGGEFEIGGSRVADDGGKPRLIFEFEKMESTHDVLLSGRLRFVR